MQASHAAYEAGKRDKNNDIKSLALCEADSEDRLIKEAERLEYLEIPFVLFREPDIGDQATAICTLPLSSQQRKRLARWKLWEA